MKILLSLVLILSLGYVPCLADNPPTQFEIPDDALPKILPRESQQLSFRVFSKDGKDGVISDLKVVIVDIKDPDNKSLPTEDITYVLEDPSRVTAIGNKVTLTFANPQHFERVGDYKIMLRFIGTAVDGKPMITKTLSLNRPVTDINLDELKDRTIELSKWPWSKASKTVNFFIFDPSGKAEFIDLSAYGQEILVANSKVVAPGKVTVQVVNNSQGAQSAEPPPPPKNPPNDQPGKRINLKIGLSDLTWPGSFVTNLVLYSPSFGGRKLIPMNLSVKDNPVVPLLVIFLGVIGGFTASLLSKRWLPSQRNEYRLVKLQGELDWLFGVTIDPKNKQKLYNLKEKLDAAREKNDAGEASAAAANIEAVETELKTFCQERALDFGKTQADAQQLREQVREYLKYPTEKDEAQRILDALSGVESLLSIDELDRAKGELTACQKSFDALRKNHFSAQLKTYKDRIKNLNLPANDTKLANINPLIQEIETALAKNELDQLPGKLNALQALIDNLLPSPMGIVKLRSPKEIAAEAKRIDVSPPPESRIVNAKITFHAKVPDGTVIADDEFHWKFSDGVVVTEKKGTVTHRFDRAWNYQVECSIMRGVTAVAELPSVMVMILAGPTEKALKKILRNILINESILSGFALALAALTGLYALYVNHPFGTLENYILAFLWGFGIDATIKGFTNISKKLSE